ncbi:MAG TPA: hypothetical protein VKE70_13035, partial [Candidatus Solibacter sp.]|nr:hypothetical protein [Candidatus Solibacter sp.]
MVETVQVYYRLSGGVQVDGPMFTVARERASALLAEAGIRLEWHYGTLPEGAEPFDIGITFVPKATKDYEAAADPHALASAQPYSTNTNIVVFHDRVSAFIRAYSYSDGAKVMGHVLAHEIVHMLENVARHSESGLMTAHWKWQELRAATGTGLHMAAQDRELVLLGIEARRRRAAAARSAQVAAHAPVVE